VALVACGFAGRAGGCEESRMERCPEVERLAVELMARMKAGDTDR
jgi:hypothetical protein